MLGSKRCSKEELNPSDSIPMRRENSALQRMYRLSKRNVKNDEKAKSFIKKAKKQAKQIDEQDQQAMTRVAKDLKNELILQMF